MSVLPARPRAYVEATVTVPRLSADAICNYIIENICTGLVLEEEDDSDQTSIIFYVPPEKSHAWKDDLVRYLSIILESAPGQPPAVQERLIEDVRWDEQYRRSIRPIRIGTDIVVRPPWHRPPAGISFDIVIEPRMAFGTGSHETTRSCLLAIRREFQSGDRFLDVGCGSGILSILAAKMGAAYIKAIDIDPDAIQNCQENFSLNGVSVAHDVRVGSISDCVRDETYDFVCANIIRSTIIEILTDLVRLTTDGGTLVLSGLLEADESEVSNRLRELSVSRFTVARDNEWLTYTLKT